MKLFFQKFYDLFKPKKVDYEEFIFSALMDLKLADFETNEDGNFIIEKKNSDFDIEFELLKGDLIIIIRLKIGNEEFSEYLDFYGETQFDYYLGFLSEIKDIVNDRSEIYVKTYSGTQNVYVFRNGESKVLF